MLSLWEKIYSSYETSFDKFLNHARSRKSDFIKASKDASDNDEYLTASEEDKFSERDGDLSELTVVNSI